jgi:hypothetical protein
MSNQASIQQDTTTVKRTRRKYKNVSVFDDYGKGTIHLDTYCDTFYEDDLELLLFVLERIKEGDVSQEVEAVIDYVYENQKGITIEGTLYGWDKIKSVFDKVKYGE